MNAIAMRCWHEDAKRLSPEGVAARCRQAIAHTPQPSSNNSLETMGGSTYMFWLGASAEEADPALVASDQAAPRLAPTGFDPLRCEHVWWDYRDDYRDVPWRMCSKCATVEGLPT